MPLEEDCEDSDRCQNPRCQGSREMPPEEPPDFWPVTLNPDSRTAGSVKVTVLPLICPGPRRRR